MKRRIAVITTAAAGVLLFTATSGAVEDKQAPGYPGHKVYRVKVYGAWQVVPEQTWDRCGMEDSFPLCALSIKNPKE